MIAKPPKSRTTRGRFFFNRAQRDFSLGSHFVDVLGHLGVFAGLGQQPGDVQIGLPPCLVVNFPFDGGKACWITHQAIQPLRLAFGQQPSRLVRDGGWRGCRRAVGTLTLSSSLFLVPAHLLFRLQKHFHNGLFPSCQSPVLFSLRPFAYLNTCALRCVTAFWDRTLLELEESTLTCLFASITIRQTQRSASHESSLAIYCLFDTSFHGVADQSGDQPTQRDVLLLGESAELAQQIVGQNNMNVRICVHCELPSAINKRYSNAPRRMDKVC